MIKRLIAIGLILVCHVVLFVAVYFGRVKGVTICGSDITLFIIPFVIAFAAFAIVFARMIKTKQLRAHGLLVIIASIISGTVSTVTGMTIAFNLWGT